MKKFFISLWVALLALVWYSFAENPSILNQSYTTNWNDVTIFWTNNSNWWNVDINLLNPNTQEWLHFGTVKISDEMFTFSRQWSWEQSVWLIPDDGWDEIKFRVPSPEAATTRTVIPAVPRTGPSGNTIAIILATLTIFGWYIFIKRKADI